MPSQPMMKRERMASIQGSLTKNCSVPALS